MNDYNRNINGNLKVVNALIKARSNLNLSNSDGHYALYYGTL